MIFVEDDTLDLDVLDLSPRGATGFDVVACTGPHGPDEVCPLVMDGTCPAGRPDVVVSALSSSNPWARSVRAAWALEGVPIASASDGDARLTWPEHIGAALRVLNDDD